MLVEDVDLLDGLQHWPVGVALEREEPLVSVFDVVGGQLAPVDRGLRVPADALLQLEDVGRVVRLGPGLGEVGLERVGHRLDGRARLHLHQAAVDERQGNHRRERDRLVGVEADRIDLEGQAQDAAPFGRLRHRRPRTEVARHRCRCQGPAAGLEELTARDGAVIGRDGGHGALPAVADTLRRGAIDVNPRA